MLYKRKDGNSKIQPVNMIFFVLVQIYVTATLWALYV